jgi:hypothetical protein
LDSCGILLIVAAIGLIVIVPIALKASAAQEAKLGELREAYHRAKSAGEPSEIVAAARAMVHEVRQNNFKQAQIASEIYQDMLKLLRSHSELKPFALETGRLAYGLKRKDGVPTVYDEQAILNDINAHA